MKTGIQRPDLFAWLKDAYWRAWYSYVCRSDRDNELLFMNYGYQGDRKLELDGRDERDRYAIQMYDMVVGAIPGDLAQMTLLEVGCGRGGGMSYVGRYLCPGSMTGVDICEAAVEFCSSRYTDPRLSFRHGDALDLPLGDEEVDAVINVESSHRYADMERFLDEVRRVLKPGGYFSFVDFRARSALDRLRGELAGSGMEIVADDTMTKEVLSAMALDNPRKLALIDRRVPAILRKPAREFASVLGSASYRSLAGQHREYVRFLLRKPDSPGAQVREP